MGGEGIVDSKTILMNAAPIARTLAVMPSSRNQDEPRLLCLLKT